MCNVRSVSLDVKMELYVRVVTPELTVLADVLRSEEGGATQARCYGALVSTEFVRSDQDE